MAAADVAGMLSSDMDPQDLPTETATFRGTWGTHEEKKWCQWVCRGTMQHGCENQIAASLQLVWSLTPMEGTIQSGQMANKSSVDELDEKADKENTDWTY